MLKLKDISQSLKIIEFIGDENTVINNLIELRNFDNNPNSLTWSNDKNIELASKITGGSIICSSKILELSLCQACNYIIVENPRNSFQQVIQSFFAKPKKSNFISPSSFIDDSVKLGNNLYVGQNVVIEENCTIGNNVFIGHNTVIMADTVIHDDVVIGSNNTIGGIGFGYEKNEHGQNVLMPHIGNVILEKNVEVGNNTCIDRAMLGSTIISENVKIDNQIHIAHGVILGRNTLVMANAMIAGSTVIGENVWVAPSSAIINASRVGDNAFIGIGAVVVKEVEGNIVVAGNPAKFLKSRT